VMCISGFYGRWAPTFYDHDPSTPKTVSRVV
jgi:hypothetical protein